MHPESIRQEAYAHIYTVLSCDLPHKAEEKLQIRHGLQMLALDDEYLSEKLQLPPNTPPDDIDPFEVFNLMKNSPTIFANDLIISVVANLHGSITIFDEKTPGAAITSYNILQLEGSKAPTVGLLHSNLSRTKNRLFNHYDLLCRCTQEEVNLGWEAFSNNLRERKR